jgi:tetratricopeptide (TPR) repeat protein
MELREPPRGVDRQMTDKTSRGLLILILALLLALSLWLYLRPGSARTDLSTAARHREVAAKLQAAGALDEAAQLYAAYLQDSGAPDDQRARIAYSLGTNYMQSGDYEQALRWFYETEVLGAGDLSDELSSRIVHCLERLGRHHAAQAALENRVQMDPEGVRRAEDDPVVARLGQTQIYRSEVMRALDSLPPEVASNFASPEGQQELLKKYVADELLWRQAVKLEYDRDPEVARRQTEVLKQLAVARFVEREVFDKIQVDEADLQNYFAANQDRYQQSQDGAEAQEVTFDQVRQRVERDYQMFKMSAAYNELIDTELSTQDVELFPEKMGDG